MPLNIKNDQVSQLAVELSEKTGQSITSAVGAALEAQLAELRRQSQRNGVAARLRNISKKCASLAPKDWLTRDFDAELYDERGLPRT